MRSKPHHLAFVVLPEFSHMSLALAIEPLFVANWLTQEQLFRWSILSLDGLSVRASNGQCLPVDGALGENGNYQIVIVVASFNSQSHASDMRLLNWLKKMARFGVTIGAIETGSEILAAAHLLDDQIAAIHWDNLEGFSERYPRVSAQVQLYTITHDRMTCAGSTATLDMMLHWLGNMAGAELASEVAQHFLMPRQRASYEGQNEALSETGRVTHEKVLAALKIMHDTLDEPLSCKAIAYRIGLSQRQLQRYFQRYLSMSIARQYLTLRLAKAHKLLQQTELPVTEISVACGFSSLENFSRTYRRYFGLSPSADRQQTTTAPVFRQRMFSQQ